jgi:DNA-binding transcriptional ArsR family regulator
LPPAINRLNQRVFPALGAPALIHAVAGRDLPLEFAVPLHIIERLVIVPTPHVDLYAAQFGNPTTLWLFLAFSAVTGWTIRQSPIRPKEALARIEPLNDETRLRILELLARRGELGSQELMAALEISQPSLSRHLKALGGYITERRGEGAGKFYRLNPGQLEWSFTILRRFLAAEDELDPQATAGGPPLAPIPASDTPLKHIRSAEAGPEAQTLRSFVNAQGRITRFPAREKEKLIILEYLIGKFEARRSYTEKEVNALILEWITFSDFVTIRRALYDYMFLNRERDGSRYWLNPDRSERTENQEPQTGEPNQ